MQCGCGCLTLLIYSELKVHELNFADDDANATTSATSTVATDNYHLVETSHYA